jgi:hypothetical protein
MFWVLTWGPLVIPAPSLLCARWGRLLSVEKAEKVGGRSGEGLALGASTGEKWARG